MPGYEITWNEVSSTSILQFICTKVTRSLTGTSRGSFLEIPGREGSWFYPEQRGRRQIQLDCVVVGDNPVDRRNGVVAVADWLDVNNQARLQISSDPGVYYNAVLQTTPDVDEWVRLGKFSLSFSAEPYSYDVDASQVVFDVETDDEWSYDFGVVAHTYPVIEIKNTGATPLEGFFFSINDTTINVTSTLGVGATITINSIGAMVLAGTNDDENLTGAYNPANGIMSGVYGEFPEITPGTNSLEIEGEQVTDLEVKITYRKRYRR